MEKLSPRAFHKSYETQITMPLCNFLDSPRRQYRLSLSLSLSLYVSKPDCPLREREPSWILGRDSSRLFSTSSGLIMARRVRVPEKCCLLHSPSLSSHRDRPTDRPIDRPTARSLSIRPSSDRIRTIPLIFSIDRPDIRICFREAECPARRPFRLPSTLAPAGLSFLISRK